MMIMGIPGADLLDWLSASMTAYFRHADIHEDQIKKSFFDCIDGCLPIISLFDFIAFIGSTASIILRWRLHHQRLKFLVSLPISIRIRLCLSSCSSRIHSCSIHLPMAFNRDGDGKSAAPGFPGRRTLQIYFTVVVFYNFMNDCQPQSRSLFLVL